MKKRTIQAAFYLVFLVLVALAIVSCSPKDTARGTHTTAIQVPNPSETESNASQTVSYEIAAFDPIVEFQGEAFPVKLLSIATANTWHDGSPRMRKTEDFIGDQWGDFGVNLLLKSNSPAVFNIRVEIEGSRFINKSSLEALIQPGKEREIFPRIVYKYEVLERLVQPASENVYFRLFYNDTMIKEKMEVVRFHSVNEVPFIELSRRDNETLIDHKYFFAAYVDEDNPIIDTILKEALQIGVVDKQGFGNNFSFSGYQLKDAEGSSWYSVDLQVLAVWSVFLNHNIKYSSITATSTANERIATQYVRTLGESFNNSQANCVDGSVLFASVLRKIGIEPFLVIVPGHMLLGYISNENPTDIAFLETTMMGNIDLSKHTKDDSWWGKFKNWSGLGTTQSSATLNSFLAAQRRGREQFEEVADRIFDDEDNDCMLILISEAREQGIMPITRY
jgi:hypothetical protein